MGEFRQGVHEAVSVFWRARGEQSSRTSVVGAAGRGAVTGGRQMDGFVALIRALLKEAGCPDESIFAGDRVELPGWYRAEKKWDLLVVHRGCLVAALEFKSQVGPSFGNNFNNRSEEALGSASDLLAAYREGAFRPAPRPWLGYVMLLEDCPGSRRPIEAAEPHFKVFEEFRGASYRERYVLLLRKMVRDGLYSGASLLLSGADSGARGEYVEADPELAFEPLARRLAAHVGAACRPHGSGGGMFTTV